MPPVYGRSPWVDRFPKSRVPAYPKHSGNFDVDVAIIGGGLTGCTAAYAFAAAGIDVALFEADRIGRASAGRSAGWITDEPSASFTDLDDGLGRRAARHAWQAWRRASLDFAALLRRLDVKCGLEPHATVTVAQTAEQAAELAREQKVRRDAGFDASLMPQRSISAVTGFPAVGARRSKESAVVDPYRATLGVAAAAVQRGARVFERSPVTKTSYSRVDATLTIGTALIRAKRIIVATGNPGGLFKPLARHFTARTAFLVTTSPVPLKSRRTLGTRDHLIRDSARPPHRLRWLDDERILVSGADAESVPARSRDEWLVQRTGQLMYELSTLYPEISGLAAEYGWDAPYSETTTGLPVVGPHRNYPHHLFACGGGQSLTGSFLASRMLLRHYADEQEPSDASFGFGH